MGQSTPIAPNKGKCLSYRFSTLDLPPQQQFEAWRALNSSIADMLPAAVSTAPGFSAEINAFHLGNMIVSRESFDGLRFEVGAAAIRRGSIDHWILGLYKSGSSLTLTDDRVSRNTLGTVSMRSLTRPFSGESTAVDMLFVYIPRDLFPQHAAQLDRLNGICLEGPLVRLLSDFLVLLFRELPTLTADEASRIAQTLQSMIVNCLVSQCAPSNEADLAIQSTMLERARRLIQSNIQSPSLSPQTLSTALGISRATLYRLFEPLGGVGREIRKQRLLASHRELIDPSNRRRIGEIAEGYGFNSATDFARSYRQQFGIAPSQAQRLDPQLANTQAFGSRNVFSDWLRSLGK